MLDQVLANRDTVQELGITGSYLDSFAAHLAGCGYAATSDLSRSAGTLQTPFIFSSWRFRNLSRPRNLNPRTCNGGLVNGIGVSIE